MTFTDAAPRLMQDVREEKIGLAVAERVIRLAEAMDGMETQVMDLYLLMDAMGRVER